MNTNTIEINSDAHTEIVTASADSDHRYYVWSLDSYLTDDYVVATRDGERVIVERMSEDEAWQWTEENRSMLVLLDSATANRDAYKGAYERECNRRNEWREQVLTLRDELTATRIAFERALVTVASKGRDYARDNELCENYERFVMLGVNREALRIADPFLLDNYGSEVHGEDSLVGEKYREYMRMFVRYATRTRKAIVTVGRQYNAYVTRNGGSDAVLGDEVRSYYGEVRSIDKDTESVMSYEECCKANEYAIRHGWSYAANAFGESADDEEC
jgi:hypothetical protein